MIVIRMKIFMIMVTLIMQIMMIVMILMLIYIYDYEFDVSDGGECGKDNINYNYSWMMMIKMMMVTDDCHEFCEFGWVAVLDRWWGHNKSAVEDFFSGPGWEPLILWESKCTATRMEGSVWTVGGTMLKNKTIFSQIWLLHHSQPMNFSTHPRMMRIS